MLVVSSSVGVLDGIHGNSTHLGPLVTLDAVLVEGAAGLEEGLVGAASASDDADLGTAGGGDGLLAAGREAKAASALVLVVGDYDGVVSGGAGVLSTVSALGLDVADDGPLGDGGEGEDVSDVEGRLLSAVNELAGVHALGGDEELVVTSVLVGVLELDLGDGGSTSGVVDDVLHDAPDVAVLLGVVEGAELHGSLTGAGVGAEDSSLSLTASGDDLSHVWIWGSRMV